ncbi:MAG: DNRLRE domain-containing protein [Phycisphaerae bacterium]|nr:DNRLRE domain-containing protein [Phycisphaerae bacterium]
MKKTIGLLLLLFLVCTAASADTITFQNGVNGYSGNVDACIRSESGRQNYNYGTSTDIAVGWELADAEFVGFSQWSFSGIPSGLTIEEAKLGMYCRDAQGTEDRTIHVYAMTSNITNMGTGNSRPATSGEVCWNYLAYDTATWGGGTTNGPVSGTDYTPTYGSSLTISVSDEGGYVEFDVTAIVNAWYTGALSNYGFILRDGAWDDNETRVNLSSADTDLGSDYLPYLEITYTPEPATMALLLAGGGLAILRRRTR